MPCVVAKEVLGRNITVNAIAPGPTATKPFLDGKPTGASRSSPNLRLWSGSDNRLTSRRQCLSSRGRMRAGSTGRWYTPTAEPF